VGDQLFGGTGANQTLVANLAGATLTDGTGANQALEALGRSSIVNINSGPSDTVTSQGGDNTINVAAIAHSTEVLNVTSTDVLDLADSFAHATLTKTATGVQIAFSDTGQIVDVNGTLAAANFNGVQESLTPPPHPTTVDYTQSALNTLLTGILDSADLIKFDNHIKNGAVVETDTGGPYNPLSEVTDSTGHNPTVLMLDTSGETINFDSFASVHNAVLENGGAAQPQFTLNGSSTENIYLQPIPGAGAGHLYLITDNLSTLHVFGSDGAFTLDDGGTHTIVAQGGGNGFNLENGTFTLKLGGDTILPGLGGSTPTANNYVDIANFVNGPVTANITGWNATTDVIAFQGIQSDYNIVKTTTATGQHITTVTANQSEGGFAASVTIVGWHDMATFANPAHGYAAGPVVYI